MPSGAKKRKAAKKKKENHPSPSSVPTQGTKSQALLGGDEEKHQDDRHSDFGEASSTTSQDHPSHHDLLTEGEEEKTESVSNLPPAEGVKIESDNEQEEGTVVSVEREFKIEGEFERKNGKYEHDETQRKSYDGGSSRSSSSSSGSSSDDESHGLKSSQVVVVDTVTDSVKADHSLHVETIDPVPTSTTIGEGSDSVVDCIPPVVSDKVSLLSESVEVNTTSTANSSVAPSVVESVFKETDEKKATFDPKTFQVEETDDRLSLSYNSTVTTHDNEADAGKDSGVTQPLLVPPPRPVETASWKSCCGLFELFSGSNR